MAKSGKSGSALKEFFVAIGLDADEAAFASAQSAVDALEAGLKKLVNVAQQVVEGFAKAIVSTAAYGNEINDISERTGESTDAVQQLGFAAGVTGETLEGVEISINHLARSMAAARDGGKEAVESFTRLKTHVVDANGKLRPINDVLLDLADGFQKLPKGAERSSAALSVLGKSGTKMLNVFSEGREGFERLNKQFEALGIGMSQEQIERADRLNKSFNTLRMFGTSLVHDFAEPFVELLGPLIDGLLEWAAANREIIRTRIQDFARGLITIAQTLVRIGKGVVDFFQRLVAVLRVVAIFAIVPAIVLLSQFIFEMIAAAGVTVAWLGELLLTAAALAFMGAEAVAAAGAAAAAWIAANAPLILMTVLVAGLILGFMELFVFLRGGRSVINRILNGWADEIEGFWEGLKSKWWFPLVFGMSGKTFDRVALAIGDWARGDTPETSNFVGGGAASPAAAASLSQGMPWETNWAGGGSTVHAPVSIMIQTTPNQSNEAIGDAAGKAAAEQLGKTLREAKAARK